jgi:hypothetical protein
MDRLLTFVGLGAFGLLVQFWHAVFAADSPRPQFVLWRMAAVPVAVLLVVPHVVLAPIVLSLRAAAPLAPRAVIDPFYIRVPFDETIERQDLVVVNPPFPMFVGYCVLNYEHDGQPSLQAVRVRAPGLRPVTVKRTDEQTLEVTAHVGYLTLADRIFRNELHPLQVGEQVHLARMTATILAVTDDGRPQTVAFRFATPLEALSLRWLRFQAGEYVPWSPPSVGEDVTLESDWQPRFW